MAPITNIQSYADAQAFLFSRFDLERTMSDTSPDTFKLDRMRQLAELLDNPQSKIATVHVAGTKGKGSVSSMLSHILSTAGYKTGLFTSPHLEYLGQRFCIDNQPCQEADVIKIIQQIIPAVEEMDRRDAKQSDIDLKPTFFEITTAFAFLYFLEKNVDVAIVEVGLGGRLDSTNICEPLVTAITNIGLDHTEILGDTLELIAAEKAGIVKTGIPLVNGCELEGPRNVIEQIALERNAPVLSLARDVSVEPAGAQSIHSKLRSVSIKNDVCWEDLTIGLPGNHQINNAAVCLGVIWELTRQGFAVEPDSVRLGLSNVRCNGRLELVDRQPRTLLDVAHNPNSAQALVDFLNLHFADTKLHLILSCSEDKQVEEIAALLAPNFHSITLTKYQKNPRSVDPQRLYDSVVTPCNNLAARTQIVADPREALESVKREATADDLIVITGSFYLIAELRPVVQGLL